MFLWIYSAAWAIFISALLPVSGEQRCDKQGRLEAAGDFSCYGEHGINDAVCLRAYEKARRADACGSFLDYDKPIETNTEPAFKINVHPLKYDPLQSFWGIVDHGIYYDKMLTLAAQMYLHGKPRGIVFDVGSNIGWLSLYAAAMGHEVYSFDPNLLNIVRQCQAQAHNSFNAPFHIVDVAMGDEELVGQALSWEYHAVTATLLPRHPDVESDKAKSTMNDINVTTIDAFLAREEAARGHEMHIAFLKIDVEGFEPMVIKGALNALKHGKVRAIYMEVSPLTETEISWRVTIEMLLATGYELVSMSYCVERRPSTFIAKFNEDHDIGLLLFMCVSKPARQCDTLWELKSGPGGRQRLEHTLSQHSAQF